MGKFEHDNCIICGQHNPYSLGLKFYKNETGKVFSTFKGNKYLQGYNGIMHGGVIAALLDSVMVNCLSLNGVNGYTCELKIRYKKAVPYNSILYLESEIVYVRNKIFGLSSRVIIENSVYVVGEAKFME